MAKLNRRDALGIATRGMLRRFRFPWRSALDIRRDVDEELEFHLALRAEELELHGLSRDDARREALRLFGDLESTRRDLNTAGRHAERTTRVATMIDALARDARYALRSLRRNPGFAIAATLVLSLGIGSSVVVFSMLDTLVLRPLPLREPDRLLAIGTQPPRDAQWTMQTVRLPVLKQWQTDAESFEQIDGYESRVLTWRAPDGPERIVAGAVVGDLFSVLGAPMAAGRPFTTLEHETAPAVLSHTLWRRRFGSSPDVVGETIDLDGVSHKIFGVLPPETGLPQFGGDPLVWIPLPSASAGLDGVLVYVVGRLRAGVAPDDARPELATIQRRVEDERGFRPNAQGVVLQSMQQNRAGIVGATLAALFGGSLLLLIIACANVGTLALTRLVERRHELAVRASLGASRWRILRQIVTEHVVLWSIGGGLGIVLGAIGLRSVLRADPAAAAAIPSLDAISIDGRVVLFACGITLVTALVFALLPALESAERSPVIALREDGTAVSSSRRTRSWRQLLVVAQVALSTVLASGACLLTLSHANLTSQPLGFRPNDLLTFRILLPQHEYPDQPTRLQFQRELLATLRALPGVEAAATTSALPLGTIVVGPTRIEGADASGERQWAGFQSIDRDYFRTAGVSVVSGRAFTESDGVGGDPVVIINEAFAQKYFNGQDPIGRRVALPGATGPQQLLRVVGVAEDVKHAGLDFEYLPELFIPYDQIADGPIAGALGADVFTVLRVPDALAPTERALRQAIAALDPNLPLMKIRTGGELVAASASSAQFRAAVMAGIAVLAVLLSGIGLYAVLAQNVAQRRKEFGIRMAIGATPSALLKNVCRYGIGLGALGIAGGVLAALALARYVQSLLFGISALEPAVFAGVGIFMLVVAAAAATVPALRTTRLSPTLAIRNQ